MKTYEKPFNRSQACETKRFASVYNTGKTWFENKTIAYFQYKYPEVIHSHTYISYDLISLIGELGGILGLTLGASILSLFEASMLKCISFFEEKDKNKQAMKASSISSMKQVIPWTEVENDMKYSKSSNNAVVVKLPRKNSH